MIGTKLTSRIKATVISAVMAATVLITPAFTQMTDVSAASATINHTFVTTSSTAETATNKAKINVASLKGASTITFNLTTDWTEEMTIGIYGGEISEDPWWFDDDFEVKVTPKSGKASFTYEVPSDVSSTLKTLGIGIWYPKDGTEVTLTTATTDSSAVVDPSTPGEQDKPVTENAKSGSWTFTDNKDGTASVSSTLTAEIYVEEGMDYLLTAKHDEEMYIDPETGKSTYQEGDPINSHKFKFNEFGLEDLDTVTIQSFNYVIESEEAISNFEYGGGINVEQMSPADTEYFLGKNGYWYNDHGAADLEDLEEPLPIEPHGAYKVENFGTYAEVVWDVPTEVQPYVSKNNNDTVGFQFWYAQAEDGGEEGYAEVDEVHLKGASCTYTRSMTVPYTKTINKKVGQKLTPGSDEASNQYKYDLADLGLVKRDLVSAVKFNVTSSADLTKFTGGVGISVGNNNGMADEGWYMPDANITVLDPEAKTFEIMWIVPEGIRKDVDILSADGNIMFGAWYAGTGTEGDAPTITLNSMDFYVFETSEADLVVEPEKLEIAVGEEKALTINVKGCEYISSNQKVAICENGVVKGLAAGNTNILVRSPEGQEFQITVKVVAAATTTAVTTTAKTTTTVKTTTTTPVTTVDPNEVIDWSKVMYGDVNLDELVNVADIVALNMYLLNAEANYINATARENAQCVYDGVVDSYDSTLLMNYVAMIVDYSEIGPQD